MSSDRPLSLSPLTWHTPTTTEPPTNSAPGPLYNLQQMMLADARPIQQNSLENVALATRDRLEGLGITLNRQTSLDAIQTFTRHMSLPNQGVGSVDLTLSRSISSPHSVPVPSGMIRNGQNGESSGPISLSVRDTKQINSMDTAELNKLQTGRSLDIINTNLVVNQRSNSPKSPKPFKRSAKKMDTVLERLNSAPADLCSNSRQSPGVTILPKDDIISQINHEVKQSTASILTPSVSLPLPVETRINVIPLSEDASELHDKTRHKRKPDKTTRIEKEIKGNDSSLEVTVGLSSSPTSPTSIEETGKQVTYDSLSNLTDSEIASKAILDIPQISSKKQELNTVENVNTQVKNKHEDTSEVDLSNNSVSITHLPNTELQTVSSPNLLIEKHNLSKFEISEKQECDAPSADLPVQINSIAKSTETSMATMITKRRNSNEESHTIPLKVRKKTCSESETIDNIAAMIASGDNASVMVPLLSKPAKCEENAVNDSQSLAHVLAGPEEKLDQNACKLDQLSVTEQPIISNNNTCLDKQNNVVTQTTGSDSNINMQTTNFVQVENELEKMFAGIDETITPAEEKLNLQVTRDSVTSTSNENNLKRKTVSNIAIRTNRKSSDSAENTPKKKKISDGNKKNRFATKNVKAKGGKNGQKNKKFKSKVDLTIKDVLSYDSGSNTSSNKSRGPFIQIKGPKDSPISVSIINTSINDEDSESRMKHHKTKKHHDDAEFRQKMRKGLHSSTLSMKYDATTTDVTWVCVFCKNGPHCGGTNLGDLFGPYLVTTSCPEFEYSKHNPEDDPFKSKRTKQDLIAKNVASINKAVKKKKNVHTDLADVDIYTGMVEASQGAYEVWGHEECIIWAPGVFLVGSRVIGLEGAVWSSCRAKCSLCNITGANVGCSQRGCGKYAHISCAARNDWQILEDIYKATCPSHHST